MRILFATDLKNADKYNPYTFQLQNAVKTQAPAAEVYAGVEHLMRRKLRFDAIHIQWPESIFGWRDRGPLASAAVRQQLKWHKRYSRVITTVHNYAPQATLQTGPRMFETVYSSTDDFIHLGHGSRDFFMEHYRQSSWLKNASHHVIAHGEYDYYRHLPRNRHLANLAKGRSPLILVFGALRHAEEERLARQAFLLSGIDDAVLMFAGPGCDGIKNVPCSNNIIRHHSRVEADQIMPLFEAADMIFIPRRGRLNSGVVSLALTFGVPVIGPSEGVIEEQLIEFGGFLYTPGDPDSAAQAMRTVASLDATGLTQAKERMDVFRRTHMLWADIAKLHLSVYARPRVRHGRSRFSLYRFLGGLGG